MARIELRFERAQLRNVRNGAFYEARRLNVTTLQDFQVDNEAARLACP